MQRSFGTIKPKLTSLGVVAISKKLKKTTDVNNIKVKLKGYICVEIAVGELPNTIKIPIKLGIAAEMDKMLAYYEFMLMPGDSATLKTEEKLKMTIPFTLAT